jgi:hypothetical protein
MPDVDLKFTKPELQIEINRDKANFWVFQPKISGKRFNWHLADSGSGIL